MTVECAAGPFQICGACKRAWPTWDQFVLDPAVRLLGLQSMLTNPDVNLLVFEHSCGSSISILSRRLRHLLPEPEPGDPTVRLLGTTECRGHCRLLGDLEACDAPCSNARDRKLILLVQRMKKEAQESASVWETCDCSVAPLFSPRASYKRERWDIVGFGCLSIPIREAS
ncbi:MAG: hypothetical protein ABSH44_00590 [Bryobacteraceae bacterium]|jgi:hypothetical protein